MNEVITNVNMFSMHMIITIFGKRDCGLVVVEKGDWIMERFKDFADETMEPEGLLSCMGGCDILGLCSR